MDSKQSNPEKTPTASSEKAKEAPVLDVEKGEDNKPVPPSEQDAVEVEQEDRLTTLEADVTEAKDKYLRLYAEFENYRRRTAQEKTDMIHQANERLLATLLPVMDDFQRAEKSNQEDQEKNLEGFKLIQNKLQKTLEQFGVEEMELPIGADFDPDIHEAVTKMPVDDDKLKGKVVDVLEKGYKLHDKVIRYAKIVVGE